MLNTILNASFCAGCVFVVGTIVLSFAFIAQFREPGDKGLGILLGIEFVLLYGISIALGTLFANLARWLAIEGGWGESPWFPFAGRILGGFLLAIAVTLVNNWLLNMDAKPPKTPDQATASLVLKGRGGVTAMDLSPDGDRLASSSSNNAVYIWNAGTGEMLLLIEPEGNQDEVHSVSWSPDGQSLAAGLHNGQIHVWEAGTGKRLLALEGHKLPAWDLKWSPKSNRLASGSIDGTAIVWNMYTACPIMTLRHPNGMYIYSLAWSPDATRLATAAADGTIIVWEIQSGTPISKLENHSSSVLSVAWSPDAFMFASASRDATIIIWDTQTWQPVHTLTGHMDRVVNVSWSPDGTRLASCSDDRTVAVWDAKAGQRLLIFDGNPHSQKSNVFWSPNGERIISTWGYAVVIWDVSTEKE